ncbi:MAG: protein kinase [Synechococcaceae cyanobacterium ELA739]
MSTPTPEAGQLIGSRYRLERRLSAPAGDPAGVLAQGELWQARDQLAAEAPVALRRLGADADQARARELWSRLQGVLHPQVPRFGAVIQEDGQLWLVREWQSGRTYGQLLEARHERQMVFGAGEVLLLLRQLLPVLAALHSQELLHGDLSPDNLLRRDSDGLPVLLDFGLVRGLAAVGAGESGAAGATPGYAPPELLRGEPAQPWMDLHALGVVALVLLAGEPPGKLLDPVSLAWRWPVALEPEPALLAQLQRLLERDPARRFASAGQALGAFQALEMPDSTGPVARADRTVALVPPLPVPPLPVPPAPAPTPAEPALDARPAGAIAAQDPQPQAPQQGVSGEEPDPASVSAAAESAAGPAAAQATDRQQSPAGPELPPLVPGRSPSSQLRRRDEEREEAAEGGLWPVLIALVLSAVVGTFVGWWWLGRDKLPTTPSRQTSEQPTSLPPAEVDQRQQLLDRLRAIQVDRTWFLQLVDASLLAQYPERRGRLPTDSLEDAPLRKVWNDQAQEWLARVEQLPLAVRRRLGSFSQADWQQRQQSLLRQGLSTEVLRQLVSASAQNLLPGRSGQDMPEEPYRQLWYAAAEQVLENVRIDPIEAASGNTQVLSADVPASGARLFAIRLPEAHGLALGVNGTPLLQMSVYGADGTLLEPKGPLRVVTLGSQKASPVQLLITNEGVAPAMIRLSLRADPPPAPATPAATTAPARGEASPGGQTTPGSQAEPTQEGAPSSGPATPPPPVEAPAPANPSP